LNNMTKEQNTKVMAHASKLLGDMRPPAKPWDGKTANGTTGGEWAARSAKYRAGQGDADAGRLEILQQELSEEKNAENRARLQRDIARLNGAASAPTGTGATVAAAAGAGSGAKVEITQTNNIKVDGDTRSGNVDTRLKAVLDRVNADLVRNFQGATK
jgi:hypothetical protein